MRVRSQSDSSAEARQLPSAQPINSRARARGFPTDHDSPKAANAHSTRDSPSSFVSGLRSERPSPPRSALAGPGRPRDAERRTRNVACAPTRPEIFLRREDTGARALKPSRGPGAARCVLCSFRQSVLRRTVAPARVWARTSDQDVAEPGSPDRHPPGQSAGWPGAWGGLARALKCACRAGDCRRARVASGQGARAPRARRRAAGALRPFPVVHLLHVFHAARGRNRSPSF
jgi:hypothetical protein